jgi:hypothetical protein
LLHGDPPVEVLAIGEVQGLLQAAVRDCQHVEQCLAACLAANAEGKLTTRKKLIQSSWLPAFQADCKPMYSVSVRRNAFCSGAVRFAYQRWTNMTTVGPLAPGSRSGFGRIQFTNAFAVRIGDWPKRPQLKHKGYLPVANY